MEHTLDRAYLVELEPSSAGVEQCAQSLELASDQATRPLGFLSDLPLAQPSGEQTDRSTDLASGAAMA